MPRYAPARVDMYFRKRKLRGGPRSATLWHEPPLTIRARPMSPINSDGLARLHSLLYEVMVKSRGRPCGFYDLHFC